MGKQTWNISSSDTQVHWVSQMRGHQVKLFMDDFQRLKQPGAGNCLLRWSMRSQCHASQSSGRHTAQALSQIIWTWGWQSIHCSLQILVTKQRNIIYCYLQPMLAQEYQIEMQHPSEWIHSISTQNSLLHLHCSKATQVLRIWWESTRVGGCNLQGC